MSWNPAYIVLVIITTVVDYFVGIMMGRTNQKSKRKKYLLLSLFINLGLLFVFKYFNFFSLSTKSVFDYLGLININLLEFKFLLPVGISFYTFQSLSYAIDVYNGKTKPERHLGIFALYVSFFPQLVAGPIERSDRLLPQFREKFDFDYYRFTNGLKIMIWGFFKKVVIADRLAVFVDKVYNNVNEFTGIPLIIATFFFAIQIYCDFSGYSDIAIGAAKVMGYNLMVNFNRPYFSKSISEFWKRWHISLSTWFRDYLYIPLGGNRVSRWRWYFNLFITFVISGIWHGANWTFIIWGALHGFYMLFSIWTERIRDKLLNITRINKTPFYKYYQIIFTFILVCFAWIFFRANSINDAFYIIKNLFVGINHQLNTYFFKSLLSKLSFSNFDFLMAILSILFMGIIDILQRRGSITQILSGKTVWIRWGFYYFVIGWILIGGVFGGKQFIYFQF